jgi:flagellar biosynthesis/type III secretory pathway protein FliH
MVLTVLATADGYDEAVSDAYQIGYEKGKEEGSRNANDGK